MINVFFKSQNLKPSEPRKKHTDTLTHSPIDFNYLSAHAHYYHAVGLSERDDVVGSCEHYLRALEIMETSVETSYYGISNKHWIFNGESLKTNDKGMKSKRKLQNLGDSSYGKLRFLALTYTRLGELFHNENCTSISKDAYKKCVNLYIAIEVTRRLGDSTKKSVVCCSLSVDFLLSL